MGFVANFIRFQQCKNFENRLRCDKVTESLKVGTFLRHGVYRNVSAVYTKLPVSSINQQLIAIYHCAEIFADRA